MESKIIELARKIKELADRGVGGEKVNATQKLADLLKKYDIAFTELEETKSNYNLKL